MYYVPSWKNMGYRDENNLVSEIAHHRPFSGRTINNGGLFGDYDLNGVQVAHADEYRHCKKCGKYEQYEVYSYRKLLYAYCEHCKDEYMFVETWEHEGSRGMVNSGMTSKHQRVLMRAIPSYGKARTAYLERVAYARHWLTSKRRAYYKIEPKEKLTDRCVLKLYDDFQAEVSTKLAAQKAIAAQKIG